MNRNSLSMIRLMLLTMVPCVVLGQSAEHDWSNLGRLRTGQKIEVVDMKLRAVTGKFAGFSEDSISVLVGKDPISTPRGEVLSVKNRVGSHRARNVLLGLAIGAGAGAVAGVLHSRSSSEEGEIPVYLMVWTPIGAGVGGAVGAVLPAGQVTIYRAKGRATSTQGSRE